jgi:hypothetical protein
MQLTKRGEYALRTLIRLGVAHELGANSSAYPSWPGGAVCP